MWGVHDGLAGPETVPVGDPFDNREDRPEEETFPVSTVRDPSRCGFTCDLPEVRVQWEWVRQGFGRCRLACESRESLC